MVWEELTGDNTFWTPMLGEVLAGKIIQIKDLGYGPQYLIERTDGTKLLTPGHKVLQSRLSKAKAGELVKILVGEKEPNPIKGRKDTQLYRVWVDKHDSDTN